MRKILQTSTLLVTLCLGAGSFAPAYANPSSATPTSTTPAAQTADVPPPPPHEHPWGPWGFGPHGPHGPHDHVNALLVAPEDRKLTVDDVRIIAQATLLQHGNHSWKVTEVAETPDNGVAFAYATGNGEVIARFKIDRKTGHLERVS